jgi:ABC-2 type transport system ATP-binding protein
VSLQEKSGAWVGKLSGGQRQRLAVACALVGDPELLFLDEPTTGLDPQSRRSLWEILRDLRARGRTLLVTTHYMDEAERLCDRVAIVDAGKVIALGSPAELVARLGGEHVIEFAIEPAAASPGEADYRALPGVSGVRLDPDGVALTVTEPHVTLPALLDRLQRDRIALARLATRHVSLEDVFVELTGRHPRDEAASAA